MPYPTGLVSSQKRPRSHLPEPEGLSQPSTAGPKRKRARKKKGVEQKQQAGDGEDFDRARGLNLAIARMAPQSLSDYAAARTRRAADPGWGDEEIAALHIPAQAIRDATLWASERTLDNLPAFLESVADGRGMDAVKEQGCPHTLVVAAAGLRAADIARALRGFQKNGALVAKLFAKHIKLQESIDLCKRNRINIGVGTPQRIADLIQDGLGALSTQALRRVVLDASHIDQKSKGILELKDTHVPLMRLLAMPALRDGYGREEGGIQIIFY